MPNPRKEILVKGEIYHIFNKSIGNLEILVTKRDLQRAFDLINYYRIPQDVKYSKFKTLSKEVRENYIFNLKNKIPLVEIYAFALMPNHYHVLLKQIQDNGISFFVSNFQNGFAKFFNKKYERLGGLFIRPFKSKIISTDEIFLHVSRYIHLNPATSHLSDYESIKIDPRTSYPYYLEKKQGDMINTKLILTLEGSKERYEKFVMNQIDYQRRLHLIKNQIFE